METGFLDLSSGRIFFRKWGRGSQLFIALHGFEGDSHAYQPLASFIGADQCLYALDLPWHGDTCWQVPDFTPAHFQEFVEGVCAREGREQFTAIGFSFGARIWIHAMAAYGYRMKKLILIAPDGLSSRWGGAMRYGHILWSKVGLPRRFDLSDRWLQWGKRLGYLGLLPRYAHRFLERNLRSSTHIERLWGSWAAAQVFPTSFKGLATVLRKTGIPVLMVLGKSDPLIRTARIQHFCRRFGQIQLVVEAGGHLLLRKPDRWARTALAPVVRE